MNKKKKKTIAIGLPLAGCIYSMKDGCHRISIFFSLFSYFLSICTSIFRIVRMWKWNCCSQNQMHSAEFPCTQHNQFCCCLYFEGLHIHLLVKSTFSFFILVALRHCTNDWCTLLRCIELSAMHIFVFQQPSLAFAKQRQWLMRYF